MVSKGRRPRKIGQLVKIARLEGLGKVLRFAKDASNGEWVHIEMIRDSVVYWIRTEDCTVYVKHTIKEK